MNADPNPTASRRNAGSIRVRLTVFISAVILAVILVFGYISYLGVRKAALGVARDRLKDLSGQLAIALRPDTTVQAMPSRRLSEQPAVKKFLLSGGKDSADVVQSAMAALKYDSIYLNTYLLSADRNILLTGNGKRFTGIPIDSLFSHERPEQRIWLGKMFATKDTVMYPMVIRITEHNRAIGYVVRWRRVYATAQSVQMLSRLMGKVGLYLGNINDTLWTNMRSPAHAPDLSRFTSDSVYEYKRDGDPVIASIAPIPGSPWVISIEISSGLVYLAANRFLYWLLFAGLILLAIGVIAAIYFSRSFSKPLVSLTRAVARMAEGDFQVEDTLTYTTRGDEIGRLAQVFGVMSSKLHASRNELQQMNRNLEALVEERTRQLQLVNEELESFTYSVSHDLRAPLRAILGYAHILSEDHAQQLGGQAVSYLEVIASNAKGMGTLIDDLLAFSRLGRKELQRVPINMREMVEDVITDISHSTPHKAVITVQELAPATGDHNLLRQVWQNLVSNAVKYSSKKATPEIEIGSETNGTTTIYHIKDNGAGFDMQYVGKLFGVFQRLHYANEFEGTGIGLALVHRIITRHGGRVWAEGETGKGATFYFTLA